MKHSYLLFFAILFAAFAGCESKVKTSNNRVKLISVSPKSRIKNLSEASLHEHFNSVKKSEDEALDDVITGAGRISFYVKAETIDQLKQRIGFGSFESWEQELGIETNAEYIDINNSELSRSLLASGSEALVIRGDQFKLLAFFAEGHYFGRIWDNSNMKTWAIQGEYDDLKSMANELSKLVP